MLRTLLRLTCAFLVASMATALAVAVGGETSSAQFAYVAPPLQVSHREINGQAIKLRVTLRPTASGAQIAPLELPTSAFTVHEGNRSRPVAVEHLRGDKLEVVIVADTDRGATNLAVVRATVSNLVDGLPQNSRIAIIAASPKPSLLGHMSADRGLARNAVGKLQASDGEGVISALDVALRQFSNRADVRRTIVVVAGPFAANNGAVSRTSDELTNANVDSYIIQTNQATVGTGATAYPLPVGDGLVQAGIDKDMVPQSQHVVDELFRQYRLSFSVKEKVDPVFVRVGVRALGKSYNTLVLLRLHLLPPAPGRGSLWLLGLKLAGLIAAVAAILALLFIPARRARERFAQEPVRPLLPPAPDGPALAASSAADAVARGATPSSPTRLMAWRPGPGLGGEQVEGFEAVRELLRAQRRQVRTVWLADDVIDPAIEELADRGRVPVRRASRADIDSASYSTIADGVLAHAAPVAAIDIEDLGGSAVGPMSVVLVDHIADASLGALIRTGVSCGVTGLVLPRQRANPVSPATTAVARGAIENVRMVLASSLPAAITRLRANGFLAVGIEAAAPARLLDLDLDFARIRVVLAIDGRGQLDDLVRARCDLVAGVDLSGSASEGVEGLGQRACIELARRRIPGAVH